MQYSIEVNNQVEIFDLNKVAKQASGAVLLRVKNTVVLATVAREDVQVEEDFFASNGAIHRKSLRCW